MTYKIGKNYQNTPETKLFFLKKKNSKFNQNNHRITLEMLLIISKLNYEILHFAHIRTQNRYAIKKFQGFLSKTPKSFFKVGLM